MSACRVRVGVGWVWHMCACALCHVEHERVTDDAAGDLGVTRRLKCTVCVLRARIGDVQRA